MAEHRHRLTRRELLELGLATGLGTPLIARAGELPQSRPTSRSAPQNVVFMIADGMSSSAPSLAGVFSELVRSRPTRWYELMRDPQATHGLFETHSLSSLVTDSAAAASAMGSGTRVFNGALNVLPDGTRLTPIVPLAQERGRRAGLVTTTTITHATPAGFASVQANRDAEPQIASQYLGVVDVLLGGGRGFFDAGRREDKRDLVAEYVAKGYAVLRKRSELTEGATPDRVLGLFDDGHLPYVIDQRNQPDVALRVPTLGEMTRAALDTLARAEHGFVLQVEGGRVDHAAHANDLAAQMWEMLSFDEAIAVAIDFARTRGDTLVIITADHGTGGPGLSGMGGDYKESRRCFERATKATVSLEALPGQLAPRGKQEPPSVDEVRERLRRATDIDVTPQDAGCIRDALAGKSPLELNRQLGGISGVLGQVLGNYTGVEWVGNRHTEEPVFVTAYGPGADRFGGLQRNTDAFVHVAELLGITHRNPTMGVEAAQKYLAAAPVCRPAHWA